MDNDYILYIMIGLYYCLLCVPPACSVVHWNINDLNLTTGEADRRSNNQESLIDEGYWNVYDGRTE